MHDTMISDILRISRAGKGSIKKNLIDLLLENEFPRADWTVQQVIPNDLFLTIYANFPQQVTEILILVCQESPAMIQFVIGKGWVDRGDKDKCIWAMAKSRHVVGLLDLTNQELVCKMIRMHPLTMKHLPVESIEDHEAMLEHLGLHMHASLWTLGVKIINLKLVSNEAACEFLRRAVHVVEANRIMMFFAEVRHYDFSR